MHDKLIYIVGPLKLQNTLMASFLERETGAKCLTAGTLRGIPARDKEDGHQQMLILWDCLGKDLATCLLESESNVKAVLCPCLLAFFNLSRGLGIEEACVAQGVEGFFYEEDSLEQLAKGICAIFEGELWASRKVMTESLFRIQRQAALPTGRETILTRREIEILTMVAGWASNQKIADELCVSTHTVKTHLYNTYKKIEVPNRLQAALWAVKNL